MNPPNGESEIIGLTAHFHVTPIAVEYSVRGISKLMLEIKVPAPPSIRTTAEPGPLEPSTSRLAVTLRNKKPHNPGRTGYVRPMGL
jgi:hypothetical protein